MRLHDGRYECANCGERLEISAEGEPNVTFHATGGKPNMRVLKLDGREIHRCEVGGPHERGGSEHSRDN